MYCTNCGAQLSEGAKFCHNCGSPVKANAVSVPSELLTDGTGSLQQEIIPDKNVYDSSATINAADPAIPEPSFAVPVQTPGEIELSEVPELILPESSTDQPSLYSPHASFMADIPSHPDAQVFQQSEYDNAVQSAAAQQYPAITSTESNINGDDTSVTPAAANSIPSVPVFTPQSDIPSDNVQDSTQPIKKKNRTWLRSLVIFTVMFLIAGVWYFVFGPGKSTKAPVINGPEDVEEYALGVEAFEAGDYESAEKYLEAAFEILPDSQEISDALFETYRQYIFELLGENDYINAEPRVYKFISMAEGDASELLSAFYHNWIFAILDGTADGDLESIKNDAWDYLDDADKKLLSIDEREQSTDGIADMIAEYVDSDDISFACYLLFMDDYVLLKSIEYNDYKPLTISVSERDHSYVRFYYDFTNEAVVGYYGDLDDDGKRTGTGTILSATADDEMMIYYYTSGWFNDLPNGNFTETVIYGDDLSDIETYSGTLKDGVYDGTIIMVRDGIEYTSSFDAGYVNVLNKDENGNNIFAYATDGSDNYLYITDNGLTNINGVEIYD